VINRRLSLAALVALGLTVPAAVAAQPKPAAASAQAQTRAGLMNSLQSNFKTIDTNGDGTLSAAELQAAESKVQQQRIAQLRGRVEAEFAKLDTNKDNQLSKAEFMAAAPSAPSQAANGAALLSQLDKSKDGKVTVDEYRAPVLARFDAVDTNKDGTISQSERAAAQARAKK
jgi:Ca2+-binding EF-hand superfamily protein